MKQNIVNILQDVQISPINHLEEYVKEHWNLP